MPLSIGLLLRQGLWLGIFCYVALRKVTFATAVKLTTVKLSIELALAFAFLTFSFVSPSFTLGLSFLSSFSFSFHSRGIAFIIGEFLRRSYRRL